MKSYIVVEIREPAASGIGSQLAQSSARLPIENLKVLSSDEGSFDSLSLCREPPATQEGTACWRPMLPLRHFRRSKLPCGVPSTIEGRFHIEA
jgi:hypothetical protein